MRKLTVKRTKSFVACLYTVKLYIEDISNAEITINGTPCRKLGEIKNGDEKVFEIGDDKTGHRGIEVDHTEDFAIAVEQDVVDLRIVVGDPDRDFAPFVGFP